MSGTLPYSGSCATSFDGQPRIVYFSDCREISTLEPLAPGGGFKRRQVELVERDETFEWGTWTEYFIAAKDRSTFYLTDMDIDNERGKHNEIDRLDLIELREDVERKWHWKWINVRLHIPFLRFT